MGSIERKKEPSNTLVLDDRAVTAIERVADSLAAILTLMQQGNFNMPFAPSGQSPLQPSRSVQENDSISVDREEEDFIHEGEDIIPNLDTGFISGFGD